MTFFGQLIQDIDEACFCPYQGIGIDTEMLSDLVSSNKASPVYVGLSDRDSL